MRLTDASAGEILVSRDPENLKVEVRFETGTTEGARSIRLGREEARRLAALILFQAERLGRARTTWVVPFPGPARKSA